MNKVASNDHNWHIEDESNVELTGSNERGADLFFGHANDKKSDKEDISFKNFIGVFCY